MGGIGDQPVGTSPFGLGEPDAAVTPGGSVNRNADTGLQEGGRLIDPRTRQYVLDSDGRALGMPATRQRMMLAAMTVRRSSAQQTLGHTLPDVQLMGDDYENQVTSRLMAAFQPLIDEGAVRVTGIDVERADGRDGSRNTVHYVDLTTNTADSFAI